MRYLQIRSMDISNGEGVGISLFVQGCPIHCSGCFNQEAWSFEGGKSWTPDVQQHFIDLADKDYIKRISILGGEPLAVQNIVAVYDLVKAIRDKYGETKKIWLYTGYYVDEVEGRSIPGYVKTARDLMLMCDYIVDGRYEHDQRDLSLKFRGSRNQSIYKVEGQLLQKC